MANTQDEYASELLRRFEDLTHWAIAHWPEKNYPLMQSDFANARREISVILGRRLQEGVSSTPRPSGPDDAEYIELNPTPWP